MRCAAHTQALKSIFEGRAHPLTGPMIMAAKIGLTQHILADYSLQLGRNPHFQAWFSAAQAGNRLIVRRPEEATRLISALAGESLHYGVASYFSAGRLYTTQNTDDLDLGSLSRLGVSILSIEAPPPENIPGDNPILSISLASNGHADASLLDQFLLPEDQVIVYDKYIGEAGLQLIEYLASKLCHDSALHVRTTDLGGTCKRPSEITNRISQANPNLVSSCKLVSPAFRKRAHDRYIFFGKRLQAVFTVGIDCFGTAGADGTRQNRQSKINVYALDANTTLAIEAADGTVLHTPHVEDHCC